MTVSKLNEDKILVTLGCEDMSAFSLNYEGLSFYDVHSRRILTRILNLACFKTGIEPGNKKILVEAAPIDGGCILLITLGTVGRSYRLKGCAVGACYRFSDSESFLSAMEKLYKQNVCCNKNSAYFYDGSYYLTFGYPCAPKKLRPVLREYAEKSGGSVLCAKVRECGREICRTNAIAQIGRYL